MKIYTKSGDKGRTSLATGKRVSKSDLRLESYGTADELNSYVGWLRSLVAKSSGDWTVEVDGQLAWVQNRLFDLGAILAGADMQLPADAVVQLENWIDEMQAELPELRAFILPGGSELLSLCHVCRTIIRRLERSMVTWHEASGDGVPDDVWQFVNRMSDYCFVLARFMAKNLEISVPVWEK
mgnify:FL=1|jgi:cob(I)alamin adenosyltransferase